MGLLGIMRKILRAFLGSANASLLGVLAVATMAGCSGSDFSEGSAGPDEPAGGAEQALVEDGLADAYALFKTQFVDQGGFNINFPIGYGFHPGLSTERIVVGGHSPKGQAKLMFLEDRVTATLDDAGPTGNFDLWFVNNIEGSGRTVQPEPGDQFFRVGAFTLAAPSPGTPPDRRVLDVAVGDSIRFDLDMVVVTRAGQTPANSRIAVGSRTLLEKRFFRERDGIPADTVTGAQSNAVEANDPLVRRGAQLFFNEQFGGNGRTCGTCHRADNNLTIDPAFIATLPANDPLFVAEFDPGLAQLESPQLMRSRGLILENPDGFDKPAVMRAVPHTLALSGTVGIERATNLFPRVPPDHHLGWGGDGAPGRGTLNEFAFGAIIQHLTKTLLRRPGTDFRIPRQSELDALEAFQLFSGRQRLVDARVLALRESGAERGRNLFISLQSGGKCANCHRELGGVESDSSFPPAAFNFNVSTETRGLTPDLPLDDGFLAPHAQAPILVGDGSFNVPPVIEAADTAPAFHNHAAPDIEAAVAFYMSDTFQNSIVGQGARINITPQEIADIAAFLRVLNAAENVRQTRKRVEFVRNNRSSGNTAILDVAIADIQDALDDLSQRGLNLSAQQALAAAKQTLIIGRANADRDRPAFMDQALVWLGQAKADLFTANPSNEF